MPRSRPRYAVVLTLAAIAVIALLAGWLNPGVPVSGRAEIVDGDTLRIGQARIRLTGLDAPESDQTCDDAQGQAWACGAEAKRYLVSLVAHETVTCLRSGRDRYGRALAKCNVGGADLGQQIVAAGWAVAEVDYTFDQAGARSRKLGIWTGPFVSPATWRQSHGTAEPGFWEWLASWFG